MRHLPLLVVLGLAGCPIEVDEIPNEAPAAALTLPERWPVSEPVPFDASGSIDLDGVLADVRLSFGDGAEDQSRLDGFFEHAYPNAGSFEVRLVVVDEDGATDEVLADVVVVDRADDPLCDCELGCQGEGSVCTEEGCFVQRVSERASENAVEAADTPSVLSCD